VTLVCDPADYDSVLTALRSGTVTVSKRKELALKGFRQTAHYDTLIAVSLAERSTK